MVEWNLKSVTEIAGKPQNIWKFKQPNKWFKEEMSREIKYFELNERIWFLIYVFDKEWDGIES